MTEISRVIHGQSWGLRFAPDDPAGMLVKGLVAAGYPLNEADAIVHRGLPDRDALKRALTIEALDSDTAYVPSRRGYTLDPYGRRVAPVLRWLPDPEARPRFGDGVVPAWCGDHETYYDPEDGACDQCANPADYDDADE